MSGRQAKRARREARLREEAAARSSRWRPAGTTIALAAGAAALLAAVTVGIVLARDVGPAAFTPVENAQASEAPLEIAGTDPVTGRAVSLAQFAGRPVVMAIWASWCHGCNAEGPDFARFIQRHPDLAFLGINFRDAPQNARAFLDHYGWRLPNIDDPEGSIAFSLGLQGTPTTIFLDPSHREVTRIVGATSVEGFEAALAQVADA